jgi:hypothetical protein
MHFPERYYPKEFAKKTPIKIRWKISSPCTNNRNINFCTLGSCLKTGRVTILRNQ